jgi:hypothetical protein
MAIFIGRRWGKGRILLHCQPEIFTNYNFLRKDMPQYVASTLSQLPVLPVQWDEYYKTHIQGFRVSPLRFILNDPVLGPVYYLALLGILMFILINGRRRQRAIPVVDPPQNESLKYIKTLADLYRQGDNRLSAARIRKRFVLGFIRERYQLDVRSPDEGFGERLRQKSNLPRGTVYELARHLRALSRMRRMDEAQFREFNNCLERFYREIEIQKTA